MANTANLNLARPEPTENWSVQEHFNANMGKIDEAYPPRRPVYKTISATSQSALDSALAEECASLAYGNFEVIELYGNWSGSPTNGARSLATLHRLNLSGAYYMCYVHFTGAAGYYYSGAWHWDLGFIAVNTWGNITPTLDSSKIATGSVTCVKRNGVAYVFLNNVTFKASGSNQLAVITGLPKALVQCGGVFNGIDAANTAQISAAGDSWWMGTGSTNLNVHLGSTFAKGHWANVMYPCA